MGDNSFGECDVSGGRLFQSLDTLEQEREDHRIALIAALHSERAALQQELSNLKGLFAAVKQIKLEARLAEIDAELQRN